MNASMLDPSAVIATDKPQSSPPSGEPSRFLSQAECEQLKRTIDSLAVGGGLTGIYIQSDWVGNLRWARNAITTAGDTRDYRLTIQRSIRNAVGEAEVNQIEGPGVEAAVRRAERFSLMSRESAWVDWRIPPSLEAMTLAPEVYARPVIWSDSTYDFDPDHRADMMQELIQPAVKAGMMAAGYLQVEAHGRSVIGSTGAVMYYPYTQAQYSVTVRDPKGSASGWAGLDHYDWAKIDGKKLSEIAVEKCLMSRNAVAVEPGRWTVILEPQAVCDFTSMAFSEDSLLRIFNEGGRPWPYYKQGTRDSRIGERIFDPRIDVTMTCTDPDMGFAPFTYDGQVYHPTTWVEQGVLKTLSHDRRYGVRMLGSVHGRPTEGAYAMSGGTATIEEMVETTTRGLRITRFSNVQITDMGSLLSTGYTRDGVWLIERGKITKPVKNFRFTESPLFALNNVEQLGVPQRVFHPRAPVVVPPLKIRDFSLTSLADAV